MSDQEFLCWIHSRLERYGDDPLLDFMHKLRAIIRAYPQDKITPNDGKGMNNLCDLRTVLGEDE